jgi:glycosyltransferase involved in cell wall biosynthesis
MKVLNLSIDTKILEKESDVARRMIWFGDIVEKYTILIPFYKKQGCSLAKNVEVYGSGGKNKIVQFILLYIEAKKILKKEKYNLITTQDPFFIGLLGVFLAKKYKISLEAQVHGWNAVGFVRKNVQKFVLKKASGIRVVSKRMMRKVINLGVEEPKINKVPVYVDIDSKNNIDNKKKIQGKFIFLSVSRLVAIKNIKMQIEAMRKLVGKCDCELWIVGEGNNKDNLIKLVKKYNLEKKVKFLGWRTGKELEDIYTQADCLLLTSYSEGWGRVVIEAGLYGVPTIMTDVGLAGEVVVDGENGIVIDVDDVNSLIDRMEYVIMNESFYDNISKNIMETVKNLPGRVDILDLYLEGWGRIL